MKLLIDGKQEFVGLPFGVTAGCRCDEIVFNHEDILQMSKASPEYLHRWISQRLLCRFVPGNKAHKR